MISSSRSVSISVSRKEVPRDVQNSKLDCKLKYEIWKYGEFIYNSTNKNKITKRPGVHERATFSIYSYLKLKTKL